jgi:acyl-CoA thioesterase-2
LIDDTSFVGLRPTEDPSVWELPVTLDIAGGRGQLFGGCGFGAGIEIVEHLFGRPAAWATGQFVSGAFPPEIIRLEARTMAGGRRFTQAEVVGTIGDRRFMTMLAALGQRRFDGAVSSLAMPAVTGPADSEPHEFEPDDTGSRFIARLERRSARPVGASGVGAGTKSGTCHYWVRLDGIAGGCSLALTIVADLVPMALSEIIGRPTFGSSLDNTMRFVARSTDEWVLAEMQVESVLDGVGHVSTRLWTPGGTLLALGSQTCAVTER